MVLGMVCVSLFPAKLSTLQGLIARFQWEKINYFLCAILIYSIAGKSALDPSLLNLGIEFPAFSRFPARYGFSCAFGLIGNI